MYFGLFSSSDCRVSEVLLKSEMWNDVVYLPDGTRWESA